MKKKDEEIELITMRGKQWLFVLIIRVIGNSLWNLAAGEVGKPLRSKTKLKTLLANFHVFSLRALYLVH